MKDPNIIPMLTERLLATSKDEPVYSKLKSRCIDWFDALHSSGVKLIDLLKAVPEDQVSRIDRIHTEIIQVAASALTDERQTYLRQHMAAILEFLTEKPYSGLHLAGMLVEGNSLCTLETLWGRLLTLDINLDPLKSKLRTAFVDRFSDLEVCEDADPGIALSLINQLFDTPLLSGIFAKKMLTSLTSGVFLSYTSLKFWSNKDSGEQTNKQRIDRVFGYLDGLKVRPEIKDPSTIFCEHLTHANRTPGERLPDPSRHVPALEYLLERMDRIGIDWREAVRQELERRLPDTLQLQRNSGDLRLLASALLSLTYDTAACFASHLMAVTIIKQAPLDDLLHLHAKDPDTLCAIYALRPEKAFMPLLSTRHKRQVLTMDMDL